MAFDVIHFEPAKGAASSAMEEEEERTSEKTVNADPARARYNFSIHAVPNPDKPGYLSYVYDKLHWSDQTKQERIQARLNRQTTMVVTKKDGSTYTKSKAIRKDAVTHINFIISGDHDTLHNMFMQDVAQMKRDSTGKTQFPRIRRWAMDNYKWLAEKAGGANNVVTFAVHLDESTPHIQATIVPMYYNKETKECRLNHKRFCDGPYQMKQLRTDHAEKVGKKYGLDRGFEGSKAKHEPISLWYKRLAASQNPEASKILESVHNSRDEVRKTIYGLPTPPITSTPPTFGKEKWLEEQNRILLAKQKADQEKALDIIEKVAEESQRRSTVAWQTAHEYRKDNDNLKKQNARLMKEAENYPKSLQECTDAAVQAIKGNGLLELLYRLFNALCRAAGCHKAPTPEMETARRHLEAQRVAIECIPSLDTAELHRLDKELEKVVQDPSLGEEKKQEKEKVVTTHWHR